MVLVVWGRNILGLGLFFLRIFVDLDRSLVLTDGLC